MTSSTSSFTPLEDKLRDLTLGGRVRGTTDGDKNKHWNHVIGKPEKADLAFESELKATLKDVSNHWMKDEEAVQKVCACLNQSVLRFQGQLDSSASFSSHNVQIQESISSSLIILKAVAETPGRKGDASQNGLDGEIIVNESDPFWEFVISPNLPAIFQYLSLGVFKYCDESIKEFSSSDGSGDSSKGFVRHQLLGLLQKGAKVCLVFLKRGLLFNYPEDEFNSSMRQLGKVFCTLLDSRVDVGLEIRCNIGLALAYLVFYYFKGDKGKVVTFFEGIYHQHSKEVKVNGNEPGEDFLNQILYSCRNDVNRLAFSTAILITLDFTDKELNLSSLVSLMAKNVLHEVDHGTKEAINLGTARVLEMLTQRLASSADIPLKTLEEGLRPYFNSIEFFIISYIPGHIDAVKQCCKNILSALTTMYERITLEGENTAGSSMIEDLLKKILSKAPHVKWIGLACITRSSPLSISVLKLEPSLPVDLLCAQRTCKNVATDAYIDLMSYDFPLSPLPWWEERWLHPLFETQPSQNNESNWPQKRQIISAILNSSPRDIEIQMMIKPLMNFVIGKMKSASASPTSVKQENEEQHDEINESTLLIAEAVKIASESGLKLDLGGGDDRMSSFSFFRGLVPRSVLHSWLWNDNPQIRLAGFSLLVETRKTSELFHKEDFNSLKILLKYSLVSQNPSYRQQFLQYFKKLLVRMRDGEGLLRRKKDQETLQIYEEFRVWLWTFFVEDEGLFPGSNFARRCISLECLTEMANIYNSKDFEEFGVKGTDDNLKYLKWLVDTYENNKIRAVEILGKLPIPAFNEARYCQKLFDESLTLCESIKPPDSVTGRYLMLLLIKKTNLDQFSAWNVINYLLQKLIQTLEDIQKTSLTEVSCQKPMYGIIRCIHAILASMDLKNPPPEYREFCDKMIVLLYKYNEVLLPLLGNAAPEGFIPGLPDSSDDNSLVVRSITAQMLLVNSWRSMRDICILLADLCVWLPVEGEGNSVGAWILSSKQVQDIGDHMLHLMKNLVHRGVFERVFVAFKQLAYRLWRSSNPKLNSLPSKWLNEAMDEEHMSSKCITRRSAGLPFIFQALLAAEKDNSTFLSSWVQRLFIKDESPNNSYIRIHAMNVLRGLFRDGNFAKSMMPFVPDGLGIAFRGLKSENWTERNAGLMLYGAVIRRAFGPKLNLMSAPTFFRRFPQMYDFLLGELDVCLQTIKGEKSLHPSDFTFHLLLLLSSFAPAGRVEDEHFKLSEFTEKLRGCASSPDSEVRKLAAKALIPFLSSPNSAELSLRVLKDIEKAEVTKMPLNQLHGSLLQVAGVLNYVTKEDSEEVKAITEALNAILTSGFLATIKCPTIFSGIVEVILSFKEFGNPLLKNLWRNVEQSYTNPFAGENLNRNQVPGLSISDSLISKGTILFTLVEKVNTSNALETICNWFTSKNISLIEELVEHLSDPEQQPLLNALFNEDNSLSLIQSLISCYLQVKFSFIGQSDLELKFLELMTGIDGIRFKALETDLEIHSLLLDRLFQICVGTSATNEHQRNAMIVLCKIVFESGIILNQEQEDQLSDTLVQWSDSSADDDLRYGAAISIPSVPFTNSSFTVINQSKLWHSFFNLAQDDNTDIRLILHRKIMEKGVCDRKALELLMSIFLHKFLTLHPLEGTTFLVGTILREDFEIPTDEAPDDTNEDGRLFDKSEMNMFKELVILSKILQEEILNHPQLSKKVKESLNSPLPPHLVELYELISNSKLYVSSPTLRDIINLVRMRLRCEQDGEHENNQAPKTHCTPEVPVGHIVQLQILNMLDDLVN